MEIKSYVVVGYPEGEIEQESVEFNINELERAVEFLESLRTRNPETRYNLIGILDI